MGRSKRATTTMKDVQKVIQELQNLAAPQVIRDKILLTAGRKMAVAMETAFAEYPVPSGKPLPKKHQYISSAGNTIRNSPFKSEQQQRAFFAMFKAGELVVPYVRSGRLGASWTNDVQLLPQGVGAVVGTNVPYAPEVLGDEETQQADYHKGTWTPINKSVDAMRSDLFQIFVNEVMAGIQKYVKGILK